MTRFDVPSLAEVTGHLAGVAAGRKAPDLVIRVIPEIRLTDKGLVLCPEMKLVPLFETNLS